MCASPVSSAGETLWTVEAWRGLAAWMVVFAHFRVLAGLDDPLLRFCHTGVDLFFVLSGFVFAPYFHGRALRSKAFAIRRLFRIYPAYALALAAYMLLKWQVDEPLKYVWEHLAFAHLQSRDMTYYYNPAFWSLPAEVEYYVLLPLLVGVVRGRAAFLAGLTAIALLLRVAIGLASDPDAENQAFIWLHHLPGMGFEFVLGTYAWRLSLRLTGFRARLALLALGLAGWSALAALFATQGDAGLNAGVLRGQISWMAALCFAAMVAATVQPPSSAPAWAVQTALCAGRLSYGTYLLHIAALRLVEPHAIALGRWKATLAACVLTLALAWMMHRLWEDPWRRIGRKWSTRV